MCLETHHSEFTGSYHMKGNTAKAGGDSLLKYITKSYNFDIDKDRWQPQKKHEAKSESIKLPYECSSYGIIYYFSPSI